MLEVFKEVIKGAMNPFLESSTQKHLSYIEYIDRAGNVLEQDEIIFTVPGTETFEKRNGQSENKENENKENENKENENKENENKKAEKKEDKEKRSDKKCTVSTPGVEYIFDDVGNFPIALRTPEGNVLYQKISKKSGEILPVHAGCCKSLDIVYAGAPFSGKTVHTVQMSDPLFHDALARDTGCSIENDWPIGSDERKYYEEKIKDLRQHKRFESTKDGQNIVPAVFYVRYTEKTAEKKHILIRLQDMAGEIYLKPPKENQYGYIFYMIGADELIEEERGEIYKKVFDNLMFGEKNLSKKRNYELMIIITKADLLERDDPNLKAAFEKNSVSMCDGKWYQDTHGKGFNYEAFNKRGECVEAFLKEQCPNFTNRLINDVPKEHIKFSMIASIGANVKDGEKKFQEYKPFCIDEPVLSVLADQGMYPVAVSGEKIEAEPVQGKENGLSETFKQMIKSVNGNVKE